MDYTEKKFKHKSKATLYRKQFKKKYGYRPKLFVFPDSKIKYRIVKPKGLKRIDVM